MDLPALMGPDFPTLDKSARRYRLDTDTPLEYNLQGIAVACAMLSAILGWEKLRFEWAHYSDELLLVAFVALTLRLFLDFTLMVDNERKRLVYQRRFFGLAFEYDLGGFSEVRRVGTLAKYHRSHSRHGHAGHSYWIYTAGIQLADGSLREASPRCHDFDQVDRFAARLASTLGAPYEPGTPESANLGEPGGWASPGTLSRTYFAGISELTGPMTIPWILAYLGLALWTGTVQGWF